MTIKTLRECIVFCPQGKKIKIKAWDIEDAQKIINKKYIMEKNFILTKENIVWGDVICKVTAM